MFLFFYFLQFGAHANESLWEKVAQSGKCQQKTAIPDSEIKSFVQAFDPTKIDSISTKLLPESSNIPANCVGPDRTIAVKCALGSDYFDRLVYLFEKFNINASHLQALPIFKPDDTHHDLIKREDLMPFTKSQLDTLIMAAKDASPELLSKNSTLSILRTDTKGRSGGYANWFQNPVIALSNADDRFGNLHDKVAIVHEMCHMSADINGHLDQSSDWSLLETSLNQNQQDKSDFRAGRISKEEFLVKKSEFEKKIPSEFASDYGSTFDQEDFAETCVASRYGVIEGEKSSANLQKKLEFVARKLFSGTGHRCSADPNFEGSPIPKKIFDPPSVR